MPPVHVVSSFVSVEAFRQAFEAELVAGGLLVRGAALPPGAGLSACTLELRVASEAPLTVEAQLAAVIPNVGVAVTFPRGLPEAVRELANRLSGRAPEAAPTAPTEPEPPEERPSAGTLGMRLKEMSVTEKMQLAMSGDREARTYLFRDVNKVIHLYVLKNPRIGLDEVLYAARMPTLSIDALKFIAEHREWGTQGAVCAALARHPQIPVPIALKVLSRVPPADLRVLAKGGARQPIVQAARKLIAL